MLGSRGLRFDRTRPNGRPTPLGTAETARRAAEPRWARRWRQRDCLLGVWASGACWAGGDARSDAPHRTRRLSDAAAGHRCAVLRVPTIAAAALVATIATSCVLPARSTSAYRGKAVATATAVISAVETGRFVAQLADRGRLTSAYASMAEAETDASAAHAAFDSIQPPDSPSDALRARLDALLANAVDTLSTMRIIARRGDLDRLRPFAAEATKESADLQHLRQTNR
jgi:hypothetical protein